MLSLGVADLPVASLIGEERLLHWRVVAQNHDDPQGWVLDARDQHLQLSEGVTLAPLFAEAHPGAGVARATIQAGQLAYLDLFYAVGVSVNPPSAALTWRVRRGPTMTVATTVFERLPDMGWAYTHYRPAQYHGGVLNLGNPWCIPAEDAWSDWLRPYAGYCSYRYGRWADGFAVARGNRRWNYQRERQGAATARAEDPGSRWRDRSGGSGSPVVGPAAPPPRRPPGLVIATPGLPVAEPTADPQDRARWNWNLEQVVRRPDGSSRVVDSGRATGASSSFGTPSPDASSSRMISSFDAATPTYKAPPSSLPSFSSASGAASPASSSSSSGSASPSPAPSSPSGGDSVGSRWRSR